MKHWWKYARDYTWPRAKTPARCTREGCGVSYYMRPRPPKVATFYNQPVEVPVYVLSDGTEVEKRPPCGSKAARACLGRSVKRYLASVVEREKAEAERDAVRVEYAKAGPGHDLEVMQAFEAGRAEGWKLCKEAALLAVRTFHGTASGDKVHFDADSAIRALPDSPPERLRA